MVSLIVSNYITFYYRYKLDNISDNKQANSQVLIINRIESLIVIYYVNSLEVKIY